MMLGWVLLAMVDKLLSGGWKLGKSRVWGIVELLTSYLVSFSPVLFPGEGLFIPILLNLSMAMGLALANRGALEASSMCFCQVYLPLAMMTVSHLFLGFLGQSHNRPVIDMQHEREIIFQSRVQEILGRLLPNSIGEKEVCLRRVLWD